jgi:hypothetical protein
MLTSKVGPSLRGGGQRVMSCMLADMTMRLVHASMVHASEPRVQLASTVVSPTPEGPPREGREASLLTSILPSAGAGELAGGGPRGDPHLQRHHAAVAVPQERAQPRAECAAAHATLVRPRRRGCMQRVLWLGLWGAGAGVAGEWRQARRVRHVHMCPSRPRPRACPPAGTPRNSSFLMDVW